ncbi:siroheme synthase CysG [Salinisphaera orenii]|uniref:Siroheme synthase n=1 Tax=Salinisphaera orenii YIM 95161 TaxID=1051139 RepID=A0A423PSR4_9GAMM|nr:siroheme synthase CysG [Salinisphaera halophila]ROO28649.1 sirohydrochlorin ferrochelatase [Salinisphaera halophila YIM 95161]
MSDDPLSLPIFLRLSGHPVLVAGAGRIAARRLERLLGAGARVTVIAPEATAAIRALAEAQRLDWQAREARTDDVAGYRLLFATTDDPAVNAALADAARAAGVWVQRADAAGESDFLVPATVTRDTLQVAISSDGRAPTLTRILGARLESWLPRAYGDLAALAGEFREAVRTRLPRAHRGPFWTRVLDGPIAETVLAGRTDQARVELARAIDAAAAGEATPATGEVYLVGAGPGDPDLLTFRALRLMQRADVVLHDSLIQPALLDLVNREAERIHVGKRAARHTLAQERINELMVRLARDGHRVLRLKGGDPFVFGRGGEEIAELAAAGVPFQIVPGVTAANGCAAYAGIPLTHRDYAQSVVFVTGHLKAGALDLSWPELARAGQTVVFFMGLKSLPVICEALMTHGLAADWPAALVIDGTTAHQRLIAGTLDDLPARAAAETITGPTLLIVGEVVRLNATLGWFHPDGEPGA